MSKPKPEPIPADNPFPEKFGLAVEAVRAWYYRASIPATAILMFYGIGSDESWALWVGLLNATFTGGLAAKNTSTSKV